jgi:Lectin C-type domain
MFTERRLKVQCRICVSQLVNNCLYLQLAFVLSLVFVFNPILIAQDTVTQKLDNAKSEFDAAVEKAKSELLKALLKKEEAAKKAGNLKLLEKIEAEVKALEDHDEMPASVSILNYDKQLLNARRRLAANYKDSVSRYTKEGNIELAKAIQKEFEEFEKLSGHSRTPIPKDAARIGNRAYKLFNEKLTWEQAVIKCTQLGGRMACPTSEEENAFISKLALEANTPTVWIGVTDQLKEGTWVQTDGSAVQFSKWGGKGPNNYKGIEHCGVLSANNRGEWWDLANDPVKHAYLLNGKPAPVFICEWVTGK